MFRESGCGACHTLAAAGSTGSIGPNLDVSLKRDAKRVGKRLAAFVRESIADPNAFVAPGYPRDVMPNYGRSLATQALDDVVAFVATRSLAARPDLPSVCLRVNDLPGSTVARQQSVSLAGYEAAFERDFSAGRIGASRLRAAVCKVALTRQALEAGLLFTQAEGELLGPRPGVAKLLRAVFAEVLGTSSRFVSVHVTSRRKLTVGDGGVELSATVRASGTRLDSGLVTIDFAFVHLQVGRALGRLYLLGEPGSRLAERDVVLAAGIFAKRIRSGLAAVR